jgi:class 3 adenylate cyclase
MTARLGDTRAVEMVRAHDALVRRALKGKGGREVKHTGDGIMASFDDVNAAADCARTIQQAFEAFNLASKEKMRVRIGLDAGEPLEDSNDLFGATVQMAARLCQSAGPDSILVSEAVRDRLSGQFDLTTFGRRQLKGIAEPAVLYEGVWR